MSLFGNAGKLVGRAVYLGVARQTAMKPIIAPTHLQKLQPRNFNFTYIAAAPYSSGGGGILDIMKQMQTKLTPDLAKSTKATFQFDVTGANQGTYFLDLKTESGTVGEGAPKDNKADCTITVSSDDFVQLFNGKLSPTSAYMSGKIKIKGDMTKAMALDKLLKKLK